MEKNKTFIDFLYLVSIVFLPWWIALSCQKSLEFWVTNRWNTEQSEIFFNDIQEKSLLEKFIEFEELHLLDEMVKEYPETHLQKLFIGIHNETIQLIKITYSILGNKEVILLNSWVQEFLYNLNLCIGFHSPHGWELMIGSIYNDFGFAHNEQIISGLVSTFPVILDTILKYWIFHYLNRVSPSLVVIYHSMND
ncbi:hypothetical protein RND81_05G025800 [Saponaria officinalis]|uniref:Envelope membrane protein, chloroplastic n=1 Tax=Saponaria officinalis TaxID=3572 RepID=A0AAW1KWQ4_SAPOF